MEGSTAGLPVGVVVVVVSLPEPTGRSDPLVVSLLDPLDPLLLLPLLPLDPLEPEDDDFGFFTVSACAFVTSTTSLPALGSSPLARTVTSRATRDLRGNRDGYGDVAGSRKGRRLVALAAETEVGAAFGSQ